MKFVRRTTFLACLLAFSFGWAPFEVQAQSLLTNLVFFLPLDGNANDVSVNALHGVSTGVLAPDRNGVPNSAYSFTSALQQRITMPASPLIRPPLPLTLSFYAKFQGAGGIAFTNNSTPYLYTGVWMGVSGTQVHLDFGDGGTTSSGFRRSKVGTVATPTAWHHYVGVIRSATDMDIYVDCVNIGGFYDGTGGPIFYNANPAVMARGSAASFSGGVGYLSGTMDEIGFWSRALTPAEVLQLCNNVILDAGISLKGDWNGAHPQLNWESTSPEQVRRFTVERSLDGNSFQTVQALEPNGLGSQGYVDASLPTSHAFYRILRLDRNGSSSYSNVVEVSQATSAESAVTAYPNPFEDQLGLMGFEGANPNASVSIWSSEGKLVYQGRPDETGQLRGLALLGRGLYFLATDQGGRRQTVKIVRQ